MITWHEFLKAVLHTQLTDPEAKRDAFVFVQDPDTGRRGITKITAEDGEVLIHIEE